jgi:hypothetical protein
LRVRCADISKFHETEMIDVYVGRAKNPLKVHKAYLIKIQYLTKLLNGKFKEGEDFAGLPDEKPEVFQRCLNSFYTGQIYERIITNFALLDNEEFDDEWLIVLVRPSQRTYPLLLLCVCWSGVRWMRMLRIAADSRPHPAPHINTRPSYGYSGD